VFVTVTVFPPHADTPRLQARSCGRPCRTRQIFDVTLVGRVVTVQMNGTRVICEREIPGMTGGALASDEGPPGPLMLQGDHGAISFRHIVVTPTR